MPGSQTQQITRAGKSVAHGATLMVAMRAIARIVGIISTAILARLLTPDDFGLVVLGSSVLNVAQMISELSLGAALIRMKNVTSAHYQTAWTIGLLRALLLAAIVVLAAPYVAETIGEPRIMPILWTLAAATTIQSLESIRIIDFQINMEFGGLFRYQFLTRMVSFFATLALAITLRSYWALVISTLITSILTVCYSYILAPHRPRLSFSAWRDLFDFSKWAVLGTYLAVIDNYSITFLMGWIGGVRTLGLYQVSQQIAALPASEIAAPIRPPLFAAFARLTGNPTEMARTFTSGFGFLFLVITPMSLGIFVTAPMIAPLALGSQWAAAPAMIQAVVFYALFDAFGHYPQNLFVVMDRQPRMLALAVVFLSIRVPAAIYGSWMAGAIGAIYGMVATALFGAVFWFVASLPMVAVTANAIVQAIWRSTFASSVMVFALLGLRQAWDVETTLAPLALQFLVFVAAGATLYIGTLLLLWQWLGYPDGAEAKAIAIFQQFLSKLRRTGLGFV